MQTHAFNVKSVNWEIHSASFHCLLFILFLLILINIDLWFFYYGAHFLHWNQNSKFWVTWPKWLDRKKLQMIKKRHILLFPKITYDIGFFHKKYTDWAILGHVTQDLEFWFQCRKCAPYALSFYNLKSNSKSILILI